MTNTGLHRHASILTLDYQTGAPLRYHDVRLFPDGATAADVYSVILALREGVTRPRSPLKIPKFGRVSYNRVVAWLEACGYPVDAMRLCARGARAAAGAT